MRRILFKLYHIQQSLEEHAEAIKAQNQTLVGLREEQRQHQQELEEARAEQARARSVVLQKEKRIKKSEKALEAKVYCPDACPLNGAEQYSVETGSCASRSSD